ncbi:MAG: phage holin family protein [Bacteroidaceae bacterium]
MESLHELLGEVKEYFVLQKRYVLLDLVEKMTIILCKLILGMVLFILGVIVILYLSVALTLFMAEVMGSIFWSCLLTTLLFALLALLIYAKRKAWIMMPLIHFLTPLFMDHSKDCKKDEEPE